MKKLTGDITDIYKMKQGCAIVQFFSLLTFKYWSKDYFQNHNFRNPYDRDFFRNWLEFWGILGDSGYGAVSVIEV